MINRTPRQVGEQVSVLARRPASSMRIHDQHSITAAFAAPIRARNAGRHRGGRHSTTPAPQQKKSNLGKFILQKRVFFLKNPPNVIFNNYLFILRQKMPRSFFRCCPGPEQARGGFILRKRAIPRKKSIRSIFIKYLLILRQNISPFYESAIFPRDILHMIFISISCLFYAKIYSARSSVAAQGPGRVLFYETGESSGVSSHIHFISFSCLFYAEAAIALSRAPGYNSGTIPRPPRSWL